VISTKAPSPQRYQNDEEYSIHGVNAYSTAGCIPKKLGGGSDIILEALTFAVKGALPQIWQMYQHAKKHHWNTDGINTETDAKQW
jgi:hypothetical protein